MASVATMPTKEVPGTGLVPVAPHEESARIAVGMEAIAQHPEWWLLQRIPMRVAASIPLPGFRVKDLLRLKPGQMLTSAWASGEDVPLKVGAVQLCWSEFEVVEQRMAVRLTRLA